MQADKSEGSPWAPWQGGKSQGSDSVWCCSGLLCIVQVVMNHLARVERRSKLGKRGRIRVMSQHCRCRTCLVCAAWMFCLFILPILVRYSSQWQCRLRELSTNKAQKTTWGMIKPILAKQVLLKSRPSPHGSASMKPIIWARL